MFVSFFPRPRIFLISAMVWCSLAVAVWYSLGDDWGRFLGFNLPEGKAAAEQNLMYFFSPSSLWFYLFYTMVTLLFYGFWKVLDRGNQWLEWSLLGSSLIIFGSWFLVQTMVVYNSWSRSFFDSVQLALSGEKTVSLGEFYALFGDILGVFALGVLVYTGHSFFVQHYIFRWRTAMNDHYTLRWDQIRTIEGASQRVQEDAMRFASIMQGLGVSLLSSIVTLFSFFPIMMALSVYIEELPLVGAVPMPLLLTSLVWSVLGTLLMMAAGYKLPGLEFENQKVEAAFRKELVYGEDSKERAGVSVLGKLFSDVRRNYFRLYFHYAYFNMTKQSYLYLDYLISLLVLAPSLAAGALSFGVFIQVQMAFIQVSNSFQYLINSWSTIVEFLSVYRRLAAFESAIRNNES